MKFRATAPVRIGHLDQIDVFVTDVPASRPSYICAAAGVRLSASLRHEIDPCERPPREATTSS